MHTKCLWLWEFSRSPTFRVHTWRACSPSLSESWLAGQPRAALCSSTSWNSRRYWNKELYDAVRRFSRWNLERRPKFQREKRPRTAQCDVLVATTWALLKTICRDLLICHPTSVKAESTWSRWKKNKRLRRNVLKSSLQLLELCFLVWLGLGQCGLSDQLCIIPNSGKKRWKRHGWKSRNVV